MSIDTETLPCSRVHTMLMARQLDRDAIAGLATFRVCVMRLAPAREKQATDSTATTSRY